MKCVQFDPKVDMGVSIFIVTVTFYKHTEVTTEVQALIEACLPAWSFLGIKAKTQRGIFLMSRTIFPNLKTTCSNRRSEDN